MNSLLRIKNIYPTLTKTEKKIAKYILSSYTSFVHESAREVAAKTGASTAAIIRFAKVMGYKGFSSLKIAVANQDIEGTSDYQEVVTNNITIPDLNKWLLDSMKSALEDTFSLLDEVEIINIANKIMTANKVFFAGVGISGLVVQDFEQRLRRIGVDTYYATDSHVMMTALAHISKNDVLFIVSHSGETKSVNKMAIYANQVGACIITVTGAQKNSLLKLANYKLIVPVKETSLRLGAINSRISCLAVLDSIYFVIAKENKIEVKNNIQKTRQLIEMLND